MVVKEYISASRLYADSFDLAYKIFKGGCRPDYIVGVWRGGTPVGIVVQELLHYLGVSSDHISIRTSSYEGIDKRGKEIQVHGLGYLVKNINSYNNLLIVDDVWETGLSMQKIESQIGKYCRRNTPHIETATIYYKPKRNQTPLEPKYYLHETDNWIVFPHELDGLTIDEIRKNKRDVGHTLKDIIEKLTRQ